jgi:hypothetical protein
MSIENFDNGSSKAAGFVVCGANAAASSAVGLGLVSATRMATGSMQVEYSEAISEAEFHAVATLYDTEGVISTLWDDNTHCTFSIADTAGAGANGSFHFVIRRIQGGAAVVVNPDPS